MTQPTNIDYKSIEEQAVAFAEMLDSVQEKYEFQRMSTPQREETEQYLTQALTERDAIARQEEKRVNYGDFSALIQRLRNTPNWKREEYGDWKLSKSVYDRAPFEAADVLEALTPNDKE